MIPLYDGIPTRRFPVMTVALIVANVAVFVLQLLLPRWGLTLDGWYYLAGARPYELTHRVNLPPFAFFPWWATVFTSMFVHGGWLHLIFNMLYLWIFGNNVEDAMTRPRFLGFYVICGLVATTTQVLVAPSSDVPLVGASGAIAGVLGAYLVLFPKARVVTIVLFPVFDIPAWMLLIVWFAIQAISGFQALGSAQPGVAFFAHIGGFLAGMALAFVFARRGGRRVPRTGRAGRRV